MKSIAQGLERLDAEQRVEDYTETLVVAKPARKPRTKAPPNETAAERFVRVGSARVSAALNALDLVGGLSSTSFEYTAEQLESALSALARAFEDTEVKLRTRLEEPVGGKAAAKDRFRF